MFTIIQGNEVISDENGGPGTSLAEYVEQLKQTIESSKIFIRSLIEKIRYQGKIKVVNKLNGNPKHPEFQSSFPDLLIPIPQSNNENNLYPSEIIDENFDLQGRKNILKQDKTFKLRMNKSIKESYYNDFIEHNTSWKVSDQFDSSENIASTIKDFQEIYEVLKCSAALDEQFMKDYHSSLFVINDQLITSENREEMIENFKKILPNINSQKLISIYANQKFLYQSYLQLISEHPELEDYQARNSRNIYKINNLSDGSIKLVVTNLSDLDIKNENYIQKYKSLGVRATVVFSSNHLPIIKYSHFFQ